MLEVKFEWKVNRIIDDIIEYGNAAAAAIWETLYLQPEELSEDELIITEEHGCDGINEDVPEEGKLTQNFELKNFQRDFTTLRAQKAQSWKLIQT